MGRTELSEGYDYMTKMTDEEYLVEVIAADTDACSYSSELKAINDYVMDFYNAAPWNEVEGHSTVVSTDVQDVVESDMPSHVRIFLGSNDILTFQNNTSNPADIQEAEEKTAYVNWIIQHQPDYFKLIHDWIKTAEIKKFGVVRYDWVEEESKTEKKYSGLDEAEYLQQKAIFTEENERDDTEIEIKKEERLDDGWTLEAKIKTVSKFVKIIPVPTDDFKISRNARSKDDAEIVGDDTLISRSELIASGFNKDKVMKLTASNHGMRNANGIYGNNMGQTSDVRDPASELIEVSTRCIKIDRDGDGIAERRKVIYSGTTLLSDEPFDHVNYALLSTILMPDEAIGKSRGEITTKNQEVKTALVRGMLDNTYRVNSGRVVVNTTNTNVDDVLTQRQNGVIRTKGDVRQAVAALETPYVADKTLQVIQYMDFARAQRTGTLMASQGLNADNINNETATRFTGVQDEGAAKTELVARVIAETGIKELYEGIAWTVSHFQDSKTEIMVLGKQLTVDPSKWRFNQTMVSNVGLAAGDDVEMINNMSGLLQIAQQLKAQGSVLIDDDKIYNMLDKITKGMGQRRTTDFFNDPSIPGDLLRAQYEQVLTLAEQQKMALEQLANNPLAEAEQIRAQAKLLETQIKEQSNQQQNQLDVMKAVQDASQFQQQLAEEQRQFNATTLTKLNELELKFKAELVDEVPKLEGDNE